MDEAKKKKVISMKIDNITPPFNFHHPRQRTYFVHSIIITMYIVSLSPRTLYRYHHAHIKNYMTGNVHMTYHCDTSI